MSNNIFFDYCHRPYSTLKNGLDQLSSIDLLFDSLNSKRKKYFFSNLITILQKAIGRDNTVWGIKHNKGLTSWELYFYNDDMTNPIVNVGNVINSLKHLLRFNISIDRAGTIPYFMFSFNIDDRVMRTKKIDGLNVYLGGRSNVSEGFSYFLTGKKLLLGNHYDFYSPLKERNELILKVKNSPFASSTKPVILKQILIPELLECHSICVSHKENMDGIYFSRVNIGQFLFFLRKFDFPSRTLDFIRTNRSKFEHLLFDAAFDYKTDKDIVMIGKKSYYGIF